MERGIVRPFSEFKVANDVGLRRRITSSKLAGKCEKYISERL